MYYDCFECGGKCCKFFGVPIKYISDIHTEGVPLKNFQEFDMNPQKYFKIHEGIELNTAGDKFIVSKKIRTKVYNTKRFGEFIIVYSKCKKLGEDGKCSIYNERPDMCKNFVASTARSYLVPNGCIFDPGNLGEDFGIDC